jgi:ferritin
MELIIIIEPIANWCKNVNYQKAASYFENEASSELEHAKGIQNYMTDFNIMPQIPQTETEHNFENLIDIINGAYQMELGLMEAYNQNSGQLFTNDMTTFDFLTDYREIQKKL